VASPSTDPRGLSVVTRGAWSNAPEASRSAPRALGGPCLRPAANVCGLPVPPRSDPRLPPEVAAGGGELLDALARDAEMLGDLAVTPSLGHGYLRQLMMMVRCT
jgi:hypothetical protein